jgi:hypothetical protein
MRIVWALLLLAAALHLASGENVLFVPERISRSADFFEVASASSSSVEMTVCCHPSRSFCLNISICASCRTRVPISNFAIPNKTGALQFMNSAHNYFVWSAVSTSTKFFTAGHVCVVSTAALDAPKHAGPDIAVPVTVYDTLMDTDAAQVERVSLAVICGGSRFMSECIEKSSDSCGVFLCRVMLSVCAGQRVRLLYISSTSAAIEATVEILPSASLHVVPALIPDGFDFFFIKINVLYKERPCPPEGVTVIIANQESHTDLFLPQSLDSPQSCFQVFQVCSPTHYDKTCQIIFRGSSLRFVFDGLSTRIHSASPFPIQVSPVVMTDSPSPVPFVVEMFVPESRGISVSTCEVVVNQMPISSVPLFRSKAKVDVFRGNGSVCTNSICARAYSALPVIYSSSFDVKCLSGLQFSNGTSFASRALVSVIRPCPVLLSANATSPSSTRANILVGGSIYVSIVDPLFCGVNTSLNLLVLTSSFRVQLNINIPFVTGHQCGKQLSFGPNSNMNLSSSTEVTFLYCSGGTQVCSAASLRLMGPVYLSLSHSVLFAGSVQEVTFSLTDYNRTMNVSLSWQIDNIVTQELTLYETSEGSGIFEGLSLVCCNVDACPGLSAVAGSVVQIFYQSKALLNAFNCLGTSSTFNTSACLNSTLFPPVSSGPKWSLRVYNLFPDAPFSVSLQSPSMMEQSLSFVGLNVLCNDSATLVALYRSSAFDYYGSFTSISMLCPNSVLGAQINFTAQIANEYVSVTAVVESSPSTSILVDSSQSVFQGAQIHVRIRRNRHQCRTCSEHLMLSIRSHFSAILLPSPPLTTLDDREIFMSFRICGPQVLGLEPSLECVHAAVGDTVTLETPGSNSVHLDVQSFPLLTLSVTQIFVESCFLVFVTNFSQSMSLRLEATELFLSQNSYGNFFVKGCLSRESVLHFDGQFSLNATLLSSVTFGLHVGGSQVSSAKIDILSGPMTVNIIDLPSVSFLKRGSSLTFMVAVRNLHLPRSNLSIFATSGQTLTIPFPVTASSTALIPVALDFECIRNASKLCALDGLSIIASVCLSTCVSSSPIQIFFAPEIHVRAEHPAGTAMRVAVQDSSVPYDHVFVNVSSGLSQSTHRLNKSLSSGLFEGTLPVLNLERSPHPLSQLLIAGKAPFVLRIDYFNSSKSVSIFKQSAASLSCFKERALSSLHQHFRIVLSHQGAAALEYVDIKLLSSSSTQTQDIRLFKTLQSHLFIGYLNVSLTTIAMLGLGLKASYSYEFDFQTQVAFCNIVVDNSVALVVSPPAISASQAFEILAINKSDANLSKALIDACFVGSALPCVNIQLMVKSPGLFFSVFNASEIFPFVSLGSPITVCFTFVPFRSCIVIAEQLEIEHPRDIFPHGSISLMSRSFIPMSENMPQQLGCSFFASGNLRSLFNVSLVWNMTSMAFVSTFVFLDQCRVDCDSVSLVNANCQYGSISSRFSINVHAPLLVRIEFHDSFVPKSNLTVTLFDSDANQDSSLIEYAVIDIESDDLFLPKTWALVETGPSTGVFRSSISSGLSSRVTVSFQSSNGQSVSATSFSSVETKADLTVTHCNRDFQCFSPQPYHLPLITEFRVCSLSLLSLALKVHCSASSQLLIPISSDNAGSCWTAFVYTYPWYYSNFPTSLESNKFICFTHESALVVSSVVHILYPSIPISPIVTYVIPQSPVLFASPIFLSSNSDVFIFLRNVNDSAPQILNVVSSDGNAFNLTMTFSKIGSFDAIFRPALSLFSASNPVLKFVWRDAYLKSDLECLVTVCSPAVLYIPPSIGSQGIANITIFKKKSALKVVLQINNTATNQVMILPVYEKFTNESGTLFQATLHVSLSRSGFGSDGQPLMYALVGHVLVVSFEDSCPFSVLQATMHVNESHVGTLQAPSIVLAGGNIPVTIDDSDFAAPDRSIYSDVVNIQAYSSLDFKHYQFPVQAQKSTFKIPTTTFASLVKQSPLLVNLSDTVTLVYEDAAPYKLYSMTISVLPSCAANISVGPLPIEINKNFSIRVTDCDVISSAVKARISTFKGFCDINLTALTNAPGVFAASIAFKYGYNAYGGCSSLPVTAGDLVTFHYVDDAPISEIKQTLLLHNESIGALAVDKKFVMLDEAVQVTLTMCINSDIIDPVLVRNNRALPTPSFPHAIVSDVTEIQLVRISDCTYVGSIRPVLLPVVPDYFDHKWREMYSPPCTNCVLANEGDNLIVWWPDSFGLESSFSIAQRAFFQVPMFAAAGSTFDIKVFDRDADSNATAIDSVFVNVTFLGQSISYILLENAVNSGVFDGSVFLSNFSALGSMTIPFMPSPSTRVVLRYLDLSPSASITTLVNITSNYVATLEVSPRAGYPGSSVAIQVLDATKNESPFIRENVIVVVQGGFSAPRTFQLFETSENSGLFSANFILSNGTTMYNVSNPFGAIALPGQRYSIRYTNSAPYAVLTKNIVIAGPGKILADPINPEQIVQVTLVDPDNSDFYTDGSSVRKIQNLIATSASQNFLAFTVQERDPGTGIFYGAFNVTSSLVFRPGVLVGVSLASRVGITYNDALPSMTVTSFFKVASIGSIILLSSSSGSAEANSEFVFKVVDFDMNLDPLRQEIIIVSIVSDNNSNFTVHCFESAVDSSEFVCRIFLATIMSVPLSIDSSVFIIPASRGQVFLISYLDSIPNAAFLTASITVANVGILMSNTSRIHVGNAFAISLENIHSNMNRMAKDTVFLTVEHRFAGFLQSSIDFALPETVVSSGLFTGIVATSHLASPPINTVASVVVPSVKPGSVLTVTFRQSQFNLFLNISVIVLSSPVLIIPAVLLNTDSSVVVSISSLHLNATTVLTPSLNVTISQTSVSPTSTITLTLFPSLSDSSLFTGSFRLCSVSNCTSDLFSPEGSSINFSYVDMYSGFGVFASRSVSTRGRMQLPTSVLSQNTLLIRVLDTDMDVSFALDTLVVFASVVGYTQIVSITLTETDSKSGIFEGTLLVKDVSTTAVADAINAPYNGTIQLVYQDTAPPIVVLSKVTVSVPDQILIASPIVVGDFFVINVSDSGVVGARPELRLSFWGSSTLVALDLVTQGLYSGRAMIADVCPSTALSSGCLNILYGTDVQVVYTGSTRLSVTIPKSAMTSMIPTLKICALGQCTSSVSQESGVIISNGGIATVLVVDYDFATLMSLTQFVSVSCGDESDSIYLDVNRGSLPATQFSATVTLFTNFDDYISSLSSAKIVCLPGSVLFFQIRDCDLSKFVFASLRVVDAPQLQVLPSLTIGDQLKLQLRDIFASAFQVNVTCTSIRDSETISLIRTADEDDFFGSIYISAALSNSNDGQLSVVMVGEQISCLYTSGATGLDARVSSVSKFCSQSFRFGYSSSNSSNTLILEAILCEPLDNIFASIQCSTGDSEDVLLSADSMNPRRHFGTITYTTNIVFVTQHDMTLSVGVSVLIPCVARLRLPSGNTTLSSSLHRREEPQLSAFFDSSATVRACIWDADEVSLSLNPNFVSFSLEHSSSNCSIRLSAHEITPFSGLFCRPNISIFDILNASPCKISTMSHYTVFYKSAQLHIPMRTAISFLGTPSFAVVGSSVSVVASVVTANLNASSSDSIVIFVRYSSGIQEQIILNETGVSTVKFRGSLYIPPVCNEFTWNRTGNLRCHYMVATYVEIFFDHLQSPFIINLHLPPEFYISPLFPVIGEDFIASVVVSTISLSFFDAIITCPSLASTLRFHCSDISSMCSGFVSGVLFPSSPCQISLALPYGVFNTTVVGKVAPSIKSKVSSPGVYDISVKDCDTVLNSSTLTATCNSIIHIVNLAADGCFLTASVNVSRLLLQSQCNSVILRYRNNAMFTHKTLAFYNPTYGVLNVTAVAAAGESFSVMVSDLDANINPIEIDVITVTVCSSRSVEPCESIELRESANASGIFSGVIVTVFDASVSNAGDGILNVLPNHILKINYFDDSFSRSLSQSVRIVAPCSWLVNSIPHKIVPGDALFISVNDVDMNPLVREDRPSAVWILNSGVWSTCNLLESAVSSGIYVGQCNTSAWLVGSVVSIYYNCSESSMQISTLISVLPAPRVIVHPNPVLVGGLISIVVFDAMASSNYVFVSLLLNNTTHNTIPLMLPRANTSAFTANFSTRFMNQFLNCSFPLTFVPSMQLLNVTYSIPNRPSVFSVAQLKPSTRLNVKLMFPDLWLEMINPVTLPFALNFGANAANLSCSVLFFSSARVSLRLSYSRTAQNISCNASAIIIPTYAQFFLEKFYVQYMNSTHGIYLQQHVSIPMIPLFNASNVSSITTSLLVDISNLADDDGSNIYLHVHSFLSNGSIVDMKTTLLQNQNDGFLTGMFQLSPIISDRNLVLALNGFVIFHVKGFSSERFYLYRACSVSIFADFVNASRREIFVDVRTCSSDSINASISALPSQSAIDLKMIRFPSPGLYALHRGHIPVSFSTQSAGVLFITASAMMQVTVITGGGDMISRSLSLPAWQNLSCFSISLVSQISNAVALGRRLFVSSSPNSNFSDPMQIEFSSADEFEVISAAKQSNGDWLASLFLEYSAYSVIGDGKMTNVTVGSIITARIGHLSCSATVYKRPSLIVTSTFNGSNWILKIQYMPSSPLNLPVVFAHAKQMHGVLFPVSLNSIALNSFLGTYDVGLSLCQNISVWVMDSNEGNLSSSHQLPCLPRLSVWSSSNRSSSFVFPEELLDIEVDFLGKYSGDVQVIVRCDKREPTVHRLLPLAGLQLFRVSVVASAIEIVSVNLSVYGFRLFSSIQVATKPVIRFYPAVIRPNTSELFIFVTDLLQASSISTIHIGLSIGGCSFDRNISLNCTRERSVFVGSLKLLPSDTCHKLQIVVTHGQQLIISAAVFASPQTEVLTLTISPNSAIIGDSIDISLETLSTSSQPAGFLVSVNGDTCNSDYSSSSVTLLPLFPGSNTFRSSLNIGLTSAVMGSCTLYDPGRYVFTAYGSSRGPIHAFLDIISADSVLTVNATRVEKSRPAGITVIDPAAKSNSNVSVSIKVSGFSISLLLHRSEGAFVGSLRYEHVAEFLDTGFSSAVCMIQYLGVSGSVAVSNLTWGTPLVPETLNVGDVVSFALTSPRFCSVPTSRIQVTAVASSFPDHLLNVSVVNMFSGASCQLSCRFKTSLYTQARPGYQESLDILTVLPNDKLYINVVFPWNESIVSLISQASFNPSLGIIAPSFIFAGSALQVTLTGFVSQTVSVIASNTAFQNAVISSVSSGVSSTLLIQTSNLGSSQYELYVRPGDIISIHARVKNLGFFVETQTAVAEIASIEVDPKLPDFGSVIQVRVLDADAPGSSEATVSIVRNGKLLRSSKYRIHLQKQTPRILSAHFDLSNLIFARITDSLIISYEDYAPQVVVSCNVSFKQSQNDSMKMVNSSGNNLTSSLSLKPSGQLQLNIIYKGAQFDLAKPLPCDVYSFQSGSSASLDVENTMLYANSFGELVGSMDLVSSDLSSFVRKCVNAKDGCLAVRSRDDVNVTCGNAISAKFSLGQLPVHGIFDVAAKTVNVFTEYSDTSVAVTASDSSVNSTQHSCQSTCIRASGAPVISCSLCDVPFRFTFQAHVAPSPSLNLPSLAFKSELFAPLRSFALADSSLFCVTESAANARIALSQLDSSCGDCYAHIASWNSSSSLFELTLPFLALRAYLNTSSCLHVWLVLPTRVAFSSAVCFFYPDFADSTPPHNSVFHLGLDCSREVIVSVKSVAVCYRLQPETESLHIIPIDSASARISWQYSPALQLPARVCVEASTAPFGCDGPMGSGPKLLFSVRCWTLVLEPCVACASVGDNLVTISRRFSVDPVAVASIFFSARANTLASEGRDIETELPFGTPVRLGLVYEGSAGESLAISERFSLGKGPALSALNPNIKNATASIEGKLVCLPVDLQRL